MAKPVLDSKSAILQAFRRRLLRPLVWALVILLCAAFWFFVIRAAARAKEVIVWDRGGSIAEYILHYVGSGPVEIRGLCESACTLALGHRETCVTPDATLGFHLAIPPSYTWMVWREYPRGVQHWITEHGGLHRWMLYMSGAEAIAIGVRRCL